MELRIEQPGTAFDLDQVVAGLEAIDPAVVVDRESAAGALRIATLMTTPELLAGLRGAGLSVTETDLVYLPSVCCGGCGG